MNWMVVLVFLYYHQDLEQPLGILKPTLPKNLRHKTQDTRQIAALPTTHSLIHIVLNNQLATHSSTNKDSNSNVIDNAY